MKRVRVVLRDGDVLEGVLIPPTQLSDPNVLVIKLKNGYNVGVGREKVREVVELGEVSPPSVGGALSTPAGGERVWILAAGGTILSRVDYVTGGVYPTLDVRYLFELLGGFETPVEIREVTSEFSEDFTPDTWSLLAERVGEAFGGGARGVVILHGTDTMHYSAAAMAFAFRRAPGPIVFVGAQRSSDRPSTDAVFNLRAALAVASRAPFAESVVVMHKDTSDVAIAVYRGTRVRKMHTSRRDAFKPVNAGPLAEYLPDRDVLQILDVYRERGGLEFTTKFERAVALVKFYPGMPPGFLETLLDLGMRGVVIEGTGFGHVSRELVPAVKKLVDAGVVVAMASQTLYGRTNLYVYRRGRELLTAGVTPVGDMLPEVAYVKLSWALANFKREAVPSALVTPMAFEISPRSEVWTSWP